MTSAMASAAEALACEHGVQDLELGSLDDAHVTNSPGALDGAHAEVLEARGGSAPREDPLRGRPQAKTYDAQLDGDIMHVRNRLGALTPVLQLVDGAWVYLGDLPIHRFTVSWAPWGTRDEMARALRPMGGCMAACREVPQGGRTPHDQERSRLAPVRCAGSMT